MAEQPVLSASFQLVGYGGPPVLRDVEFDIGPRELVAVVGGNGAGKTTLLRALSGVLVQSKGRVRLGDDDLTRMPGHRRVAHGLVHVPEGRRVFKTLSVLENLRMGAHLRRRQADQQLAFVYELFPILRDRATQPAGTLSGGEQQLLAIGRALMASPTVLLLDEASLGLSPVAFERVCEAVVAIREAGTAIVMVEQDVRASLRIADRGYVLERGTVVAEGPADDLRSDPRVMAAYLGDDVVEPTS